jgi:hypothetical protein
MMKKKNQYTSKCFEMQILILHDVEQGDRPDNNSKEQKTHFTQEQFETSMTAHFVSMDYNNCCNKCPPAGAWCYTQQQIQTVKPQLPPFLPSMWILPVASVY